MSDFICKIQPCFNNHEYEDGMCRFHFMLQVQDAPKPKQQKPIPRESKKRAKQNRIDQKQNKKILTDNIMCQMQLPGCTGFAQGVQHLKGRTGSRLTDVSNKIPACNNCNRRAETHPKEAKAKKVAKSRLSKN